MSTILDALQKQNNGYSAVSEKKSDLTPWRIALLAALMVIISLLGSLLYMQFFNVEKNKSMPISAQVIASSVTPVNEPIVVNPETSTKVVLKPVKMIKFDTQPLPAYQQSVAEPSPVSQASATSDQIVMKIDDDGKVVIPAPVRSDEMDYSDVSNELKERFQRALETGQQQGQKAMVASMASSSDIHQMSTDFQKKVPKIRYDSHMYSTSAENSWIRVNGETLKEGEFDSLNDIELVEILPNRSVFRYGQQSFTLESLVDWQGY